ncbi:MAG: hypothetical protein ACK5MK_15840 [Dysgonomonas sp.]
MLKKIHIRRNSIFYAAISLVLILPVSCSITKKIKRSGNLQTKSLFMQSKHVNIELPNTGGDNSNGGAVVSEVVTFSNPDNNLTDKPGEIPKAKKIDEVQDLPEVHVTALLRFTPEQKGMVNVDFVVKVPKEVISPLWRITLRPKVFHNDSIVYLDDVVLKGKDFYEQQKKDYKAYDDYLASIVNEVHYDSVFLDRKGISKDIRDIQGFFYDEYYSKWKKQKTYQDELSEWEKIQTFFAAKQITYQNVAYNEYARKAMKETIKKYSQGKDTTGIYRHYMHQYDKKLKKNTEHWQKRADEYSKIKPEKAGDVYKSLTDVPNQIVKKQDSIQIAKFRYLYKDIALNELKSERKDDAFLKMVKYPYEENVRVDSLVDAGKDFIYYYKQDYPVTPGLNKLRITLDAKVNAIDMSSYTMGNIDTISYFISSLAQLADTTLRNKVTKLNRDVYDRVISYIKFPPKSSKFDINYKDNRDQMKKITDIYDAIVSYGVYAFDSVVIQMSSSLVGKFNDNTDLTEKQSVSIKNYLSKALGDKLDVDSIFKARFISEDWNTLVREIQKRKDIKNKDEILNMLTSATDPDACEDNIKAKYKEDYAIIRDSIYPLLAKAEVRFNLHRTDMTTDTEDRVEYKGEDYEEGLRLLQEREYWKALDILSKYGDFNTALCYACLGYNAKAYEMLIGQPKTKSSEYLLAILALRLDKEDEAVEHLMESFKLDVMKIYRAALDPEVKELIKKRNLQGRIDALSTTPDAIETAP